MTKPENLDAIIVGAGAAGLACALELIHENNRNFVLIESKDALGGQLNHIVFKILDFGTNFENGPTLQKQMVALADEVAVPYRLKTGALQFDLKNKSIKTASGWLTAKTIVLATGSRVREFEGKILPELADKIVYWREYNEEQLRDKTVAVYGGGDFACLDALVLTKSNPKVILICRSKKLRARPDLIESVARCKNLEVILEREITLVSGVSSIESITLKNPSTGKENVVPVDALLVKIGNRPNSEQFENQLETDKQGFVRVNRQMQTSLPGVFAIGDLADGRWLRLATAQGEGVVAAHSILKSLDKESS